jgi:hypothetical protein
MISLCHLIILNKNNNVAIKFNPINIIKNISLPLISKDNLYKNQIDANEIQVIEKHL